MPLLSRRSVPDRDVLTLDWRLSHSAESAWAHLLDARHLPEWLGNPLSFDCAVGSEILVDHGGGYICHSTIKRAEPNNYCFEISWQFPDEHSTQVEVHLNPATDEPATNSSILTLQHLGLAALRDSYALGWITHLTFFEASLAGTPLPSSQFWNLHATFSRLDDGHGAKS